MNIPEILKGIELNEEQIKALDGFFKEWSESLTADIKKQYSENGEMMPRAIAKAAFDKMYENAEAGFELARKQYKRAFNEAIKDEQNKYTESMAKAMQDVYSDIEVRVKKDFQESVEYKAFENVRNAIAPVALTESQKESIEKIKEYEAKEAALEEEKKTFSKEKAIATLLADFPKEYTETVKNFISKAVTEEEVYERFNVMVEMIDKGGVSKEGKKTDGPTAVTEAKAAAEKHKGTFRRKIMESKAAAENKGAKPVFESATTAEPKSTEKPKTPGLSKFDEALINMAFPQMS